MTQVSIKDYFSKEGVKNKFHELLGEKSVGFITSVMQVINSNNYLQKATPESVYNSAAMAAVLDLPINNNLGYAWIVPYGNQAQFQMAAKGYVQLAHRTNKYKRINSIEIYESQFVSWNPITETLECDFTKQESGSVCGYYAYFELKNGFFKADYWSKEKMQAHGKRYSKSFNSGPWKEEFDKMAKKTVLKRILKDWGILSIEMEKAIVADQTVINDFETMDVDYVDEGVSASSIKKPLFTSENFAEANANNATLEMIRSGFETTPEIEAKYEQYVIDNFGK